MGKNWTQTLTDRNAGRRPGFGLPRNLAELTKAELSELAQARGIDPDRAKSKAELVEAVAGRRVLAADTKD